MLLVFAVLIAASGSVLEAQFGVPQWVGMTLVFVLVGTLEFFGREVVMRVLSVWSIVLYAVFGAFLFLSFQQARNRNPRPIRDNFSNLMGGNFFFNQFTAAALILEAGQLLFQMGQTPVAQLGQFVQIVASLRLLHGQIGCFDLLAHLSHFANGLLLLFPFTPEGIRFFPEFA